MATEAKTKKRSRRPLERVVSRRLAELIARKLFTPGGDMAMVDRLVLMRGDVDVCGWGYWPAVDAIQHVIKCANDQAQRPGDQSA